MVLFVIIAAIMAGATICAALKIGAGDLVNYGYKYSNQ